MKYIFEIMNTKRHILLLLLFTLNIALISNHFWEALIKNNSNATIHKISKVIKEKSINEKKSISNNLPSKGVDGKGDSLFRPIIIKAAAMHEVDPALIKAIIMAESGYNPKAISKKGAKGLMQLMPMTAKELGVVDCFDPEKNIIGGVKYFKQLLNRFNGNIELALAAYNAGSRNVRLYRGVPPFKATLKYIKKVDEYYQLYKKQMENEMLITDATA